MGLPSSYAAALIKMSFYCDQNAKTDLGVMWRFSKPACNSKLVRREPNTAKASAHLARAVSSAISKQERNDKPHAVLREAISYNCTALLTITAVASCHAAAALISTAVQMRTSAIGSQAPVCCKPASMCCKPASVCCKPAAATPSHCRHCSRTRPSHRELLQARIQWTSHCPPWQ